MTLRKRMPIKSIASPSKVEDMVTSRTTQPRALDPATTRPMTLLPESPREPSNSDKKVVLKEMAKSKMRTWDLVPMTFLHPWAKEATGSTPRVITAPPMTSQALVPTKPSMN